MKISHTNGPLDPSAAKQPKPRFSPNRDGTFLDRVLRQGDRCPLPVTAHAYVPRLNAGGNFCGHDPRNPRLELARPAKTGKGGLPRILTLAMEKTQGFYDHPNLFPSLNLANGSNRQMRSERREGCVLVQQAIVKRTDLATMQVGVPTPGGFRNLSVASLAQDTGLSPSRAERAFKDLKASCLVTMTTIRERIEDGSWRSLAAIKTVSQHFFETLGLGKMLKRERRQAKQRRAEQRKQAETVPLSDAVTGRYSLVLKALLNRNPRKPRPEPTPASPDLPHTFETHRHLQLTALEIKHAHPDWTRNQVYAEAQRLLRLRL